MSSENNRTSAIFQGTTNTNSVNLGITTYCTMKCPKCSIGMPKLMQRKEARHADLSELFADLNTMTLAKPFRRIHITGGEPTFNPDFAEIAEHIRNAEITQYLTVETNGWGYNKFKSEFKSLFDKVFITHYIQDAMYPGSPDNTAIIEMAQQDLGDKLIREPPVVHETQHLLPIANNNPCSKWFDPGLPAGYYHRKIYPCCVSFGIDETLGIGVTFDWREKIRGLNKGCNSCCYRGT